MAAQDIINRTFAPFSGVGKIYVAPFAAPENKVEVGNVLKADISYKEQVEKMPDMRHMGGGTYAELRRVEEVELTLELADFSVTNLARALYGTVAGTDAGSITGEAHKAYRGGLIRLTHLQPSAVTLKKGAATVPAAEYEVRPEGIYIKPTSTTITSGDDVTVDYTHGDYVNIEALTTSAPELAITLGGMNEANDGKPCIVDMWRVSQSVTKALALISDGKFGTLEVTGTLLADPNKTGVGISRFMRKQMA